MYFNKTQYLVSCRYLMTNLWNVNFCLLWNEADNSSMKQIRYDLLDYFTELIWQWPSYISEKYKRGERVRVIDAIQRNNQKQGYH